MYNTTDYNDTYSNDSFSERRALGYEFNGERLAVVGWKNETLGTKGEILGTCFKVAKFSSLNDNIYPISNDSVPDPIAVDMYYDFTNQEVLLYASSETELFFSTTSLGVLGGVHYSVSATATISEVMTVASLVGTPIERSFFEAVGTYQTLNNISTESNFPFEITAAHPNTTLGNTVALQEWPHATTLEDYTSLVYDACNVPTIIYNDSVPKINVINQSSAIAIRVKLKDNMKQIIDNLFTVTEDTLFRILLHPMFIATSSVYTKSRIIYPFVTEPIDDLTHIVFTATESITDASTQYRLTISDGATVLVDGASTGEYNYDVSLTELDALNPFTFYYTNTTSVIPMGTGQLRFDGIKNEYIGAPKGVAKNIVVKLNETLVFKLRSYRNLKINIYSNDGSRGYYTNLWSI